MAEQAHYVLAAYAVAIVGIAWLIIASYSAMRRSEALARDVSNRD